jgi:hypothetical protein
VPREKEKQKGKPLDMSALKNFRSGWEEGRSARVHLTKKTQEKHVSVLARMRDKTLEEVLQYFEDKLARVKATTVAVEMHSFCGAETKKVLYPSAMYPPSKMLTRTVQFVQMMKRVEHLAREEDVDYPTPLVREDFLLTLQDLIEQGEVEAFVFLLLQWITAARPYCVYQLRPVDIVFLRKGVSILFRKGKGVTMRQSPYTVHTSAAHFSSPLQEFVEAAVGETSLFSTDYATICEVVRGAMRKHDPTYEMRSPRRGALCCLAEAGESLKTLRMFSGHTSDRMILRYLGWGMSHGRGRKQATRAARSLF